MKFWIALGAIGLLAIAAAYWYPHVAGHHAVDRNKVADGSTQYNTVVSSTDFSCVDESSPIHYIGERIEGTSLYKYLTAPEDEERFYCLRRIKLIKFFSRKENLRAVNFYGPGGDYAFVDGIPPYSESVEDYFKRFGRMVVNSEGTVVLSGQLCLEGLKSKGWRHGNRIDSCLLLAVRTSGITPFTIAGVNSGYLPAMDPIYYEELLGIGFKKTRMQ